MGIHPVYLHNRTRASWSTSGASVQPVSMHIWQTNKASQQPGGVCMGSLSQPAEKGTCSRASCSLYGTTLVRNLTVKVQLIVFLVTIDVFFFTWPVPLLTAVCKCCCMQLLAQVGHLCVCGHLKLCSVTCITVV